ncbi:FmdB family transcriptional regulator [Occultella glacieicola]|uniref:FmdB family transcriptional regulator n=1 Tax=Occultella glacieicola TaxID=2518684 RepID=A0ABY2E3W0_9MICO|nr:FmdB family transcriptional regulator [Occultella glacieicola]
MPTYAYACQNCGHAFDIYQSFSDDALTECPNCHEPRLRKVFSPVGVVFKGSGFYRTDSRGSSSSTTGAGKSESGSSSKPASSDSSSGSSSSGSSSGGSSNGTSSSGSSSKDSSSSGSKSPAPAAK